MGTEIFHFWPWGAEKIGFKESNPISKNMAKLNFPPIQFSLSVLRNETPCTFEYPSTIRKSLMMRNKRSGSGRCQHLIYCFLCSNNSCTLSWTQYTNICCLTDFFHPIIVLPKMSIMFFSILMSWKTGDVSKKLAKVFQGVSFFNTPKENWTGGKFNLVMFLDMGLGKGSNK